MSPSHGKLLFKDPRSPKVITLKFGGGFTAVGLSKQVFPLYPKNKKTNMINAKTERYNGLELDAVIDKNKII